MNVPVNIYGRYSTAGTHVAPLLGFTLADNEDVGGDPKTAQRPAQANGFLATGLGQSVR